MIRQLIISAAVFFGYAAREAEKGNVRAEFAFLMDLCCD